MQWKHRVLTTGPPGMSLLCHFYKGHEHPQILVTEGGPSTNPVQILRDKCMQLLLHQRSPTFLAPGTVFLEDSFSTDGGWWVGLMGWFRDDSSSLHLLCTLFLLLFTVIYNEITTQLTIMQNQWESWACFHLPLTDRVLTWVCKQLIYYGLCAVKALC